MVEIPTNFRLESYMRHHDGMVSIREHLLNAFSDPVDPNDTPGKAARRWLETPNEELNDNDNVPRNYLRRRRSYHDISVVHCALSSIDNVIYLPPPYDLTPPVQ